MSKRSIGGHLVYFAIILSLLYKTKKNGKPNDPSRDPKQGNEKQSKVIETHISSLPTLEVRAHAEERKYQESREKYNWVQPALLVFTGIAAVFSAWAAKEASRQASAAEDQNRPWMYIEKMVAKSLTIDKDGMLHANVNLFLNNLGHSVAIDVYVRAELAPTPTSFVADIERYCDKSTINYLNEVSNGRVIFPDRPFPYSGGTNKIHVNKNTNLNLIELRTYVFYRTTPNGSFHRTGTFFLFKDINRIIPSETIDVEGLPNFYAGDFAD